MSSNSFSHNPFWTDNVFRSRNAVETLLGPERDAGIITPRDYDASLNFFVINRSRHFPAFFAVNVGILCILCTSKWRNPTNRSIFAFAGGCSGYLSGKMARFTSHHDYLRSLENPAGFNQAMQNVGRRLGTGLPGGLFMIQCHFDPSQYNRDETQNPENESHLILPTEQDDVHLPVPKPHSRWDEIRSANNRTVPNSAWDALRQKYEKESAKNRPNTRANSEETTWSDTVDAPPRN